ncbi:MAG: hypothetical protein B9S32_05815 [Verrucomicrobia bacterium Tous-C9LFEB]|nr:MAG: hypothetical protein B9S32_05815 [Verrucomicrobia bacterium Tous-C9LFEB]
MKSLCLGLTLVGAIAFPVCAEEGISDDFDVNGGRSASSKLNGQSTVTGGMSWQTVGNFFITDKGTVSLPPGGGSAVVDLGSGGKEWEVVADLKPRGKEWIGIALGGDKLGTDWLNPETGSQIMVFLRSNGNAGIYIQGTRTALLRNKERRISNFDESGFSHFKIIYNAEKNKLTVEANGEPLVESFDLGRFGVVLDIKKAGFHFHPAEAGEVGELDNFKITQR